MLSPSGKGEGLAQELGGIGVTGSNQSNDDLKRLTDLTMERWGRVDVLVTSSGRSPRAPILELPDEVSTSCVRPGSWRPSCNGKGPA
jgi:NAD(P)-dependent dehydrogenase (short-subunit alcohol dehydrogenase family)